LNNIERLFSLAVIQFYYGFYYATWSKLSPFHTIDSTWGGAVIMAVYLVAVFLCRTKSSDIDTSSDGKGSGVHFVVALGIVHYMIMCMINYIEWTGNSLSALAFGFGTFVSICFIAVIQLLKGFNALYIWIMFLALSLLGLGSLLYDTPVTSVFGSFTYGLGDSLGYIIISYMCACAIKRSKSLKMFRLYCLVSFIEYFIISGVFSLYFNFFEAPNKFLAFGVVLVLVTLCLLFLPLIQKRLFEVDWTDGLYLKDIKEYSEPLAETEKINAKAGLNLTAREEEVFTMLLTGKSPKETAYTLKISYNTVLFHKKNLYRKLGVQSMAELLTQYSSRNN
jgi:DNA-binding CsgD family transcriptional regulator